MYHEHYGLNRSPFNIEPDPDFLWLGEKHQEGLSVLRYGILENKGFLLLTGDVGTGKTVLINSLLTSLKGNVTIAAIPDPSLTLLDFFNIVSHEWGMAPVIEGKADFLIKFKKFVRSVYDFQNRLLVIIDEAQRLTNELLDEIRVLSNIDYENRKLVGIFFVGQIEFNQILTAPCNRALRQRITVSYHLVPLDQEETGAYIRHRLKVAGTEKELFMPGAVHEIYKFSNGTPRLINILCDRALITGYIRELKTVSPEMVRECAQELDIISDAGQKAARSAPQIEDPPAIEEKVDQAKTPVGPSRTGHRWMPVAALGAVAFILLGAFFFRGPEKNQAQESASTESLSIEIRQPINADPKDTSPATIARAAASRTSRQSPAPSSEKNPTPGPDKAQKQDADSEKPIELKLPQRVAPLEKTPLEDLLGKLAPELPAGRDRPAAEQVALSSGESASKDATAKERRFMFFFKPDSAELEDSSYEVLRQVSDFLSANPKAEVTLTAQPTRHDRPDLNAKLLELRANSIKSALTARPKFKGKITVTGLNGQGVVASREQLSGGPSKPWAEIRITTGKSVNGY